MAITLYGIPNCDSVAKARKWLEGRGISYAFHDYKKGGIDPEKLALWVMEAGLDKVLNKSGATYKALPAEIREIMDETASIALMVEQPSMIKRPIVEYDSKSGGGLLVGFKSGDWTAALG
jgi:arsenate reductase